MPWGNISTTSRSTISSPTTWPANTGCRWAMDRMLLSSRVLFDSSIQTYRFPNACSPCHWSSQTRLAADFRGLPRGYQFGGGRPITMVIPLRLWTYGQAVRGFAGAQRADYHSKRGVFASVAIIVLMGGIFVRVTESLSKIKRKKSINTANCASSKSSVRRPCGATGRCNKHSVRFPDRPQS